MELAIEKSKINVTLIPKIETINKNLQLHKKFIYNSLSNEAYLKDLEFEIKNSIKYCCIFTSNKKDNIFKNNIDNIKILKKDDVDWWPT